MSSIAEIFKELKKQGRAALIPFIMAGDPDLEATEELVRRLAVAGADLIELGVPFSDPLADGPIIQAASQRALRQGVNLKKVVGLVRKLKGVGPPLVLLTYCNPVWQYGWESFAGDCRECGVSGVVIPDLPVEEAGPWIREARKAGVDTVFLAAPTSTPERIRKIDRRSRGFIYCVSLTGVTGVREELPEDLGRLIQFIRAESSKPLAVGFGISTPAQARQVGRLADGVIVGSAIVKIVGETGDREEMMGRVKGFVSALGAALRP